MQGADGRAVVAERPTQLSDAGVEERRGAQRGGPTLVWIEGLAIADSGTSVHCEVLDTQGPQ